MDVWAQVGNVCEVGQDELAKHVGSLFQLELADLENAEPRALIGVPVANHIPYATRNLWLREDLQYLRMPRVQLAFFPKSEETLREYARRPNRPIYVMYLTRPTWYHDLVYLLESADLEPVHEIRVGDVPILKIFRLEPANPLTHQWVRRALRYRPTL